MIGLTTLRRAFPFVLILAALPGLGMAQQDHSRHQQADGQATQNHDHGAMMQHGGDTMNHDSHGGGMGHGSGGEGGGMMRDRGGASQAAAPVGQSAFAVLQDVIAKLQANPETDWSRVNIAALRQHLVDMDRVVMSADAELVGIDGGNRYVVSGSDPRTVAAIQRMVPAHALQMGRELDWEISTRLRDNGIEVTLTSANAEQVAMIRGLGFYGFMALGDHHADHHLMMAGGQSGAAGATDHGGQTDHSQH